MAFMFDKVKQAMQDVGDNVSQMARSDTIHAHTNSGGECSDTDQHHDHPFQSFAPQRRGNDAKWYVDGCSYMHAVSVALERARHEIWILDWWLSPELYLRRPPAQNERYRLDKMLFNAAHRGVRINVIVYKEVTQALTLSSSHTKHWLEDNDTTGNIRVFRHPDHLPDRQTVTSNFLSSIRQSGMNAAKLASLPGDALKGIYGVSGGTILYWAHHEKLCVVDGQVAFMGGLDLCFGRWDTNQHSIADAHPSDLNDIVFPGQDYNNARIMDFQDVPHWNNNKLDRKHNPRMGWTDVALSLHGPTVEDLRAHFAQRWNFIYFEKYDVRGQANYHPIDFKESRLGIVGAPYKKTEDGEIEGRGHYKSFEERMHHQFERGKRKLEEGRKKFEEGKIKTHGGKPAHPSPSPETMHGTLQCQIIRSCAKWSHGVSVEHSIANAYIEIIQNSEHFIYVENQFFITATEDRSFPVKNRIGAAIVERILRAAKNDEKWHMMVNIPAFPGFAGDIQAEESLGTRAIMEFQYFSICRGGHSILEKVREADVDPMKYIRFYNLRNYDRIDRSEKMGKIEARAGTTYDEARKGHDQRFGQVGDEEKYASGHEHPGDNEEAFERYQKAAHEVEARAGPERDWSSVASCYMLGGEDIRNVPWTGNADSEIQAFVSEELYIHSKLLIADDRKVICGSANLNDRSQLGPHDSEIAILIEGGEGVDSYMAGQPWRASKFAAGLRRQIFRKHLGLIPPEDPERPTANSTPIGQDPNVYDWGSREDHAVADPLADSFLALWRTTARVNTEAFRHVFHPVPDDSVLNWRAYDKFYASHFAPAGMVSENREGGAAKPATWRVGHVVPGKFKGDDGRRDLKEWLSRIKGTLVEMPLLFLKDEDIAKEGLGLNALTAEVYT